MLEPKLKVAVDYEKCHPEKCNKGVCAAVLRNATRESALPFLDVPPSCGSKRSHTIHPIPFRAFVRNAEHVLIPAL